MKTYSDHATPQPHPTRPGWIGVPAAGGGYMFWKEVCRPSIRPNHIDGPLLTFSDGQLHWLTLWERFLFALGMTDAEKLERKRRPLLRRTVNPTAGE